VNIGMLWFDNDPKIVLSIKVARAADYYRKKYGQSPTLCFVHPSTMLGTTPDPETEASLKRAGIEIRSTRTILPNHFWIGMNGMNLP
jgi:hypothetical protein